MAAVSMKTVAANVIANAAAIGSAASLTTANVQALGALLTIMANNQGYFEPLHKYLTDSHKAEITSRQ